MLSSTVPAWQTQGCEFGTNKKEKKKDWGCSQRLWVQPLFQTQKDQLRYQHLILSTHGIQHCCHFISEGTEAQRSQVICPKSHSQGIVNVGLECRSGSREWLQAPPTPQPGPACPPATYCCYGPIFQPSPASEVQAKPR